MRLLLQKQSARKGGYGTYIHTVFPSELQTRRHGISSPYDQMLVGGCGGQLASRPIPYRYIAIGSYPLLYPNEIRMKVLKNQIVQDENPETGSFGHSNRRGLKV